MVKMEGGITKMLIKGAGLSLKKFFSIQRSGGWGRCGERLEKTDKPVFDFDLPSPDTLMCIF